ncbi:TPA: hypothetical protein DEG21_02800 [Patescibacteria group bacterium]|nr:hypothetical protein [Candidatus Gracilibacteria bacterium]HBY74801.1 hypothetical protein [Candidatus Gracilibacteria bacterium]
MFASIPDDEPLIESKMLTNRINSVQKQVEGRNFDIRKHVLEYDDVLNNHRMVIYSKRNRILEQENVHEEVREMFENQIESFIESTILDDNYDRLEAEEIEKMSEEINSFANFEIININTLRKKNKQELKNYLNENLLKKLEDLKNSIKEEDFFDFEKRLFLQSIDELWMRHIDDMAHLREEVAFE